MTQRVERKIIKISNTREFALHMEKDLGLRVSYEIIRNVLEKYKYSSRVALLPAQNIEKRLRFATKHVLRSPDCWDDVIFLDEIKIMLYYHDRINRKAFGTSF